MWWNDIRKIGFQKEASSVFKRPRAHRERDKAGSMKANHYSCQRLCAEESDRSDTVSKTIRGMVGGFLVSLLGLPYMIAM